MRRCVGYHLTLFSVIYYNSYASCCINKFFSNSWSPIGRVIMNSRIEIRQLYLGNMIYSEKHIFNESFEIS